MTDKNTQPAPDGSEKVNLQDLKRKSVHGGIITMISQGCSVIVQLTSTVVLARLLRPQDYGVIAMVLSITAFAGLFRDLGLSAATIQKATLSRVQQSTLFWLNVAMGTFLTLLVAAASPLVALFYKQPELGPLTALLSTSFLIGSFGTQHGALMQRNFQFKRRAVTNIAGSVAALLTSIVLALMNHGVWSLAWGNIVGAIVTTVLLFVLSDFRPGLPQKGTGLRATLKFGASVTGFDVVNYFHRNLDNILIGRFWGADALGLYSRAYQLLMFPVQNIRGPLTAVAFPAMSRLQQHPTEYRSYYRKISWTLAFISMPLMAFLFIESRKVIDLALGSQWREVTPIFAILAITGFIQPVASLRGLVLMSSGQGRRYFHWGLINAAAVSVGFACGTYWGSIGVATSYAIVNYAILYPSLGMAFANTSLKPKDFFEPLARPAICSLAAAGVLFLVNRQFHLTLNPFLDLTIASFLFLSLYLVFYSLTSNGRGELREILRIRESLRPAAV